MSGMSLETIGWGLVTFVSVPIALTYFRNLRNQTVVSKSSSSRNITILYGTTTGTSRRMAHEFKKKLAQVAGVTINVTNMKDYDLDSLDSENVVFILCSTWNNGEVPETARPFMEWLQDLANDFRISKSMLSKVRFAVMGLGGEVYGEHFCTAAGAIHDCMTSLGAVPFMDPVLGDDASNLQRTFVNWSASLTDLLKGELGELAETGSSTSRPKREKVKRVKGEPQYRHKKPSPVPATSDSCCGGSGEGGGCHSNHSQEATSGCCTEEAADDEPEEEDLINDAFVYASSDEEEESSNEGLGKKSAVETGEPLVDMEDLGASMSQGVAESKQVGREMVTKLQRKALTKEGYKIIGTHSAVKMCRWTKNQMRGRGGCYKHSFYGITSYQCMEATPSLACANKCVFCWRHHKNPVGTEWRWKTDAPEMIVSEAIREHQAMVNQMKGVPGVVPERYQEAFTVRHCALSLVGEPIMYPHINEMVQDLHSRKISTFLVTNAQFPDQIRDLHPVTQLYVSVDAATSDSMKAVDRPLFKDFWFRFKESLRYMREKQQRTVYRMTLVKSWNMDEVQGYADLIEEGHPDFIEIKAVTYCGKSDASSLTMKNVPWHHEVCAYGEAICENLRNRTRSKAPRYGIATEHEHSCCILLAREDKFKVNGDWYTWIDYPKFDQLIADYYESNGEKKFSSVDYMVRTPEWALYQSTERGFDPAENRWKRNKAGAVVEIEYKSTDSGCG